MDVDYIRLERTAVDTFKYTTGYTIMANDDSVVGAYYLPSFNLRFSAKNIEEAKKIASFMIRAFMVFWLRDNGFKSFSKEMVKLGFRAENALTTKNILHGVIPDGVSLSSNQRQIPEDFNAEAFSEIYDEQFAEV